MAMIRNTAAAYTVNLHQPVLKAIRSLYERRRVVGVESEGYYRTVSLDPLVTGELTYAALKGMPVNIDDDVLVLRVFGSRLIIGALPDPS